MNRLKHLHILLVGLFLIPICTLAQEFTLKKTKAQLKEDKIEKVKKIELKKEALYLKFQDHFFSAIHQKAKEDYNRAIEELVECKQIYPNDIGMNFEFAKNYLLLKDYENAVFFDQEVLKLKPDNIHVLEHLKKTYRAQNDLEKAIAIQHKIISLKPERKDRLIFLYIASRQKEKAKKIYNELKSKHLYVPNEAYFKRLFKVRNKNQEKLHTLVKNRYKKNKTQKKITKKTTVAVKTKIKKQNKVKVSTVKGSIKTLREKFDIRHKYVVLKQLIAKEISGKKYDLLLEDSKMGLDFFPTQTYLYLANGIANTKLQNHQEAVAVLLVGIDFIIDDKQTERDFYQQIIKAYKGLGNTKQVTIFTDKLNKIH